MEGKIIAFDIGLVAARDSANGVMDVSGKFGLNKPEYRRRFFGDSGC